MEAVKKFDMARKPIKQRWFLTPVAWFLSFPEILRRKLKVTKINMEGLKPPYLLLSNHMAFVDFKVTTRAIFPRRANYVVAIDGFLKGEELLRQVGCICKRKFTNDILLVRQMKHALEVNRTVLALYPEARYSYCGTTSVLPDSLGKLVKILKVPVVVLIQHGNYLSQPVWNLEKRKCRLEATMERVYTPEQIEKANVHEINSTIHKAFKYDEYRWQKDGAVAIDFPNRAKGLHHILYQCPHCLTESAMNSDKNELWCEHCRKRWTMSELGELSAAEGVTEFSHIPDWFEFERGMVRRQIEEGRYFFKDKVMVDSLPNAKGYIRLGVATLTHSSKGFVLEKLAGDDTFRLEKKPSSLYSLHIEFDYFGKGDCLDLSTIDDTFYLFPLTAKNVVTKLQFAVEEMYKIREEERIADKVSVNVPAYEISAVM
ncbi:MAG TPA: hypothetical protein VN445_05800 [Rectinemataceae bacterium]|nr:hypothetical protein [Rectinemataceae bacterium]